MEHRCLRAIRQRYYPLNWTSPDFIRAARLASARNAKIAPQKRKGAAAFLSFVLEPAHYAQFLLAEPGLFLPLTEVGASAAWSGSPILSKYKRCVDLMIDLSKKGVLPGFNTGKVQKAIGPIMAQNLLSQVVQKAVVGKEDPKAASPGAKSR